MTLHIRDGEAQRAFVARTLREQGSISAREAMFDLRDDLGRSRSITRLAAAVEALRRDGWDIRTDLSPGQQAVYRLAGRAHGHAVGLVRPCPSCRREHAVGTTCPRPVPAAIPENEARALWRDR